jgi:hypothetical protein
MNLDYAFWPNSQHTSHDAGHPQAHLYPNPVIETAFLELSAEESGPLRIELVDLSGGTVIQFPGSWMHQGKQTTTLQLGGLEPGSYICRIKMDREVIHLPLIKTNRP